MAIFNSYVSHYQRVALMDPTAARISSLVCHHRGQLRRGTGGAALLVLENQVLAVLAAGESQLSHEYPPVIKDGVLENHGKQTIYHIHR